MAILHTNRDGTHDAADGLNIEVISSRRREHGREKSVKTGSKSNRKRYTTYPRRRIGNDSKRPAIWILSQSALEVSSSRGGIFVLTSKRRLESFMEESPFFRASPSAMFYVIGGFADFMATLFELEVER